MSHLFPHGKILMTPGVADMRLSSSLTMSLLNRHLTGDWGDLDDADKKRNDTAVTDGSRIFTSYNLPDPYEGERIWIITEADRSVTTFLLPSEY